MGRPAPGTNYLVADGKISAKLKTFPVKIDKKWPLVRLISERAPAAQEIGKLKHVTSLPVYEPKRSARLSAQGWVRCPIWGSHLQTIST